MGRQFATAIALMALIVPGRTTLAQSKALPLAWEYETRGSLPQAIVADGMNRPYLYVALKTGGVAILRSNDAGPPRELARIPVADLGRLDAMHLAQRGDLLYVALGDFFAARGSHAGLAVVSVRNPDLPKVLAQWSSPTSLRGSAAVLADGKHAYLGAMTAGVMVFDIASLDRIKHLTTFRPEVGFPRKNPNRVQHPNARGLALVGRRLFVAYDAGGIRVLDVADPSQPREIGRYVNADMAQKQQAYNNLVVDGDLAYAAIDYAGLEVLNVRNPEAIRQIGWWNPWKADTAANLWFNSAGHTNQLELDRGRRRIYLSAGDSELAVIDVSDPRRPTQVGNYGGVKDNRGTWGVSLAKDTVLLTYIETLVPFRGKWSGILALKRW